MQIQYQLLLLLLAPLAFISCTKDTINSSEIFDSALNQRSDSCTAFLPNGFTPNGDGTNDILRPILNRIKPADFEFTVRTENQKIIYTSANINSSWDGDDCPTGRYIATMKGSYETGGSFEQSIYVCLYTDCVSHPNLARLEFESMYDVVIGSSVYTSGENICP